MNDTGSTDDKQKLVELRRWRLQENLDAWQRAELMLADDEYGPLWWAGKRDLAWFQTADALGSYHRQHGRWPDGSDQTVSAARHLYVWLYETRRAATGHGKRATSLTTERRAYLSDAAPGWDDDLTSDGRSRDEKVEHANALRAVHSRRKFEERQALAATLLNAPEHSD